jgi:hypothetical protein
MNLTIKGIRKAKILYINEQNPFCDLLFFVFHVDAFYLVNYFPLAIFTIYLQNLCHFYLISWLL